ncbi:MAG: DUF445 family protein [Proteobacteria bacterium]|nr:DUF445 family protein [Pseudomonadota bacterium]
MNQILTYLAPPMLGAFIGYMTNYVAIRMLFKPLKPWYLFGIRVPMTPGVIPAKRHELARNIGEMVGEHLLTGSDIRKALEEKTFRNDLKKLIDTRLELIMDKELGPVSTLIPERFKTYFKVGIKILRWRSLKHLQAHISSPVFAERLSHHITDRINEFLERTLNDSISEDTKNHFFSSLENATKRFLADPQIEEWIRKSLDQKTSEILRTGRSAGDLLPKFLTEQLITLLEQEAPSLVEKFATLLQKPEMREKIASGIAGAVQNFASSMGPMAALISNFISPETIKKKVGNYLEDKGDEISQWLIDDSVQNQIARILREKAESFLATPISELLINVQPETIDRARNRLADQIITLIQNPETTITISRILKDLLSSQGEKSLQEILTNLFGENDGLENGKKLVTVEIINTIKSPKMRRILDQLLTEFVEGKLLSHPIGTLSAFLPGEVRNSINDYTLQMVGDLLVREIPGLMDALNIRRLVTRKVDSLNLNRLEGLLLVVMEEQFKYINLFGALLGFILGLLNLFFLTL